MSRRLGRREILAFLSAALTVPYSTGAQPSALPAIGFLSARSPKEAEAHTAAFLLGLEEEGFVAGQNVTIEYSWADGQYDRLPAMAADLVRQKVAAIVAVGGINSARAAQAATSSIPIVFLMGDDPVQTGLVESLDKPGGNITGVTLVAAALGAKRLGLICEIVPGSDPVALLVNPDNSNTDPLIEDVRAAADVLHRPFQVVYASKRSQFESVFELLSRSGVRGLVVQNEPFFDSRRNQLVGLAARYAVPAIYHIREYPEGGGLISYGPSLAGAYSQVGRDTGRLLKGASPSAVPVFQPSNFELVVNVKTARELGVHIPSSLLAGADEVIE